MIATAHSPVMTRANAPQNLLVARLKNALDDSALVAIDTQDKETTIYCRKLSEPTSTRWAGGQIPAQFWPEAGSSKRTGWIGTACGHLSRVLPDSGEITIEGWWVIGYDAGSPVLSDVQAVLRHVDADLALNLAPTTTKYPSSSAAVAAICDGIFITNARGGDFTEYTESLLSKQGAAVSAAAASVVSSSAVTLPDGTPYIDRVFMEEGSTAITEAQYIRLLTDRREVPILVGPGGTGKTSLVLAALGEHHITSCTREMTTLSLFGRYEPDTDNPGGFVFRQSALVKSLLADEPWYCDEAMNMPEEVQTALHPLFDDRRTLVIEEGPLAAMFGGQIKAGEKWCAVLASNPHEAGARLGRPFASRLIPIEHHTDFDVVAAIIGSGYEQLLTLAQNMETGRKNGVLEWAPQTRHLKQTADAMKFLGVTYGLRRLLSSCNAETGFSDSFELQELQRVITETFGISGLTPLSIGG